MLKQKTNVIMYIISFPKIYIININEKYIISP